MDPLVYSRFKIDWRCGFTTGGGAARQNGRDGRAGTFPIVKTPPFPFPFANPIFFTERSYTQRGSVEVIPQRGICLLWEHSFTFCANWLIGPLLSFVSIPLPSHSFRFPRKSIFIERMSQPDPSRWRVAIDSATNLPYYYHRDTRETVWDKPAALIAYERSLEGK